jgi:hypothetical protein
MLDHVEVDTRKIFDKHEQLSPWSMQRGSLLLHVDQVNHYLLCMKTMSRSVVALLNNNGTKYYHVFIRIQWMM